MGAKIGDWQLVCALRVLEGLMQSFGYPCTHTLLAEWVPLSERGRLASMVYSGGPLGTVLMLAISGAIASSKLGWPGIFYISGSFGLIWAAVWFILGANNPSESKLIGEKEKQFLEETIGSQNKTDSEMNPIPWRGIFTSVPFWALLFVHCCQNWGFWTLLTKIPTYMSTVLEFDIKSNALLSALPYFVLWCLSFLFSFVADYLNNNKIISTGASRKLFNSIGHYGPMVMLIGLGYVPKENTDTAVILLTLAVGMNAGTYVGYLINHMDLSPNYAGVLMGLTNFVSNIVSIIAPLMVGVIVGDDVRIPIFDVCKLKRK